MHHEIGLLALLQTFMTSVTNLNLQFDKDGCLSSHKRHKRSIVSKRPVIRKPLSGYEFNLIVFYTSLICGSFHNLLYFKKVVLCCCVPS